MAVTRTFCMVSLVWVSLWLVHTGVQNIHGYLVTGACRKCSDELCGNSCECVTIRSQSLKKLNPLRLVAHAEQSTVPISELLVDMAQDET